jgi:hypothetical protein
MVRPSLRRRIWFVAISIDAIPANPGTRRPADELAEMINPSSRDLFRPKECRDQVSNQDSSLFDGVAGTSAAKRSSSSSGSSSSAVDPSLHGRLHAIPRAIPRALTPRRNPCSISPNLGLRGDVAEIAARLLEPLFR